MFAVALEPEQLPHMLGLAKSFQVLDEAGLTLTEHMPAELAFILTYLADWCAPPPEDEEGARHMVAHWLKAYCLMYGSDQLGNNLGVDTLQ